MATTDDGFVRVSSLSELRDEGRKLVTEGGHAIALFHHEDEVRAVDNRCPHMGFPLHEGSVDAGILTVDTAERGPDAATVSWHPRTLDPAEPGTRLQAPLEPALGGAPTITELTNRTSLKSRFKALLWKLRMTAKSPQRTFMPGATSTRLDASQVCRPLLLT